MMSANFASKTQEIVANKAMCRSGPVLSSQEVMPKGTKNARNITIISLTSF